MDADPVSWATGIIKRLLAGENVTFRPRGHSMEPIVHDGQEVTCVPASVETVDVGDVVLCRVKGRQFLHLVKAKRPGQVQVCNARGFVNGWTSNVFGVMSTG